MLLVAPTIIWSNNYFLLLAGYVQPVCWTALWHLDALCYEGCEGQDMVQMGYRSLEWNWPKEAMNIPIWAGIGDGAKLF